MTTARRSSSKMMAARAVAVAESLADHLVGELAALGLTTYFGVPGGAIEPLFNAAKSNRKFRHWEILILSCAPTKRREWAG